MPPRLSPRLPLGAWVGMRLSIFVWLRVRAPQGVPGPALRIALLPTALAGLPPWWRPAPEARRGRLVLSSSESAIFWTAPSGPKETTSRRATRAAKPGEDLPDGAERRRISRSRTLGAQKAARSRLRGQGAVQNSRAGRSPAPPMMGVWGRGPRMQLRGRGGVRGGAGARPPGLPGPVPVAAPDGAGAVFVV